MNCQHIQAAIDAASPRQAPGESVRRHLTDCDGCRKYADELSSLVTLLNSTPHVTAPADFDFRLRARIATVRSEPRGPFSFLEGFWSLPFSLGRAATAMAAVALMATFATFYFTHNKAIHDNSTGNANFASNGSPAKREAVPPVEVPPPPPSLAQSNPVSQGEGIRRVHVQRDATRDRAVKPLLPVEPAGLAGEGEMASITQPFIKNTRNGRKRPFNEVTFGAQLAVHSVDPEPKQSAITQAVF